MTHKVPRRVIIILALLLLMISLGMVFLRSNPEQPVSSDTNIPARPPKMIVISVGDMRDPLSADLARSIKRLINDNENLQAIILDAQGLRSRQIEQLQELEMPDIGGLILAPIVLADLDKPIGMFNEAGIPVVLINQAAGYSSQLEREMTGIYFDAREAGRQQAAYCAQELDGKGKIVILAGPEEQYITQEMILGINEVLRSFPELTIADIEYGNWERLSGKISMIRILQDNQDIDAVLAQNDEMLMGALPLISGQSTKLVKIGAGATTEGLEAISQGFIEATVSINNKQMARSAFNMIISAINEDVVSNEILQPRLISDDNLDAYIREIWNID